MNHAKKVFAFLLSLIMVIGVFANTGVTINASEGNTVTVYYNSAWNQAYIHYRQANGTWTNVPGEKMSKSSEVNGYNWKATINLGNNNSTQICFNDGNGNWDSRNAQNYTVSTGTYGVRNGQVSQIAAPTVLPTATPELFTCDFDMDVTSPQVVGTTVNFTGYQYDMPYHRYNNFMYTIHKQGTDSTNDKGIYAYTDYSSNPTRYTANYQFAEAGVYEVTFKAMQYSGYTATKTKTIVIEKKEEVNTVYFSNYYAKWQNVYAYVWNNSTDATVIEAKAYDKMAKTYEVKVPAKYKNILFKNTKDGWDKQTNDLQVPTGNKNCYRPKGDWNRADGIWYEYTDKAFDSTITIVQTSPQKVGTDITLIGKSENMPGHRYNSHYFMIQKKGSSEDEVQQLHAQADDGDGYQAVWTPTQPGTYEVSYCASVYSSFTSVATTTFVIE